MKRMFSLVTIASTFAFVISILLWPLGAYFHLPDYENAKKSNYGVNTVAIMPNYFLALAGHELCFFGPDFPYSGSIRNVVMQDNGKIAIHNIDWHWRVGFNGVTQESYTSDSEQLIQKNWEGDFPGIYYRHFDRKDTPPPWITLAVSLWYPTLITAVLPLYWLFKQAWKYCRIIREDQR